MPAYHARISLEASNSTTNALIVNVLHAEVDTLTSPPDWQSIAADVDVWLGQSWLNLLSQTDTFHQITVTDENYPGSTFGQGVKPVELPGARFASDYKLDLAICALASWKTNTAKRYARGHTFLPPTYDSTDLTTYGHWANASNYFNAVHTFMNVYQGGHTAGSTSYIPEIFSKTRERQGFTPFSFRVTGSAMSPIAHYLRSRLTTP